MGNKHPITIFSLEAICCPDTPALSQPNDGVNTERKKRCSIVIQRLKGWLEIMTPCPSESSFAGLNVSVDTDGHLGRMWLLTSTHH